jgi:hypothetical protein
MIWVWRTTVQWYWLRGESRRTRRETCPSTTLSTTNPTWIDPDTNPGLRGERPATNHLSHGTAVSPWSVHPPVYVSISVHPFHLLFIFSNQDFVWMSFLSHSCFVVCPSHVPWCYRSDETWCRVQFMKMFSMQFSPAYYCFFFSLSLSRSLRPRFRILLRTLF